MKIIRYPQLFPINESTCVTIGNFDGVHLGHQALINEVVQRAKEFNCLSVVVTMSPFPIQLFKGKGAIEVLTQFKHKVKILQALGVDILCVLNFNQNLAAMSAAEFFQRILLNGLTAKYIVVGDDFRFGAGRTGDFEQLSQWSKAAGIMVEQLNSVKVADVRVSSSAIRAYLSQGRFDLAKQQLGRHFNLIGRVAYGRKMGRTLGYPTINIELRSGAFPLHGIYATHILIEGKRYQSMTSVGLNPTVGGNAKRVEVYVFDFDQDVYRKTVEVLFYKKVRNEVEFDSLCELTSAIDQDVKAGQEFFASFKGEQV